MTNARKEELSAKAETRLSVRLILFTGPAMTNVSPYVNNAMDHVLRAVYNVDIPVALQILQIIAIPTLHLQDLTVSLWPEDIQDYITQDNHQLHSMFPVLTNFVT